MRRSSRRWRCSGRSAWRSRPRHERRRPTPTARSSRNSMPSRRASGTATGVSPAAPAESRCASSSSRRAPPSPAAACSMSAAAAACSPRRSRAPAPTVTGIDLAPGMIEVARLHAAESGLAIDYRRRRRGGARAESAAAASRSSPAWRCSSTCPTRPRWSRRSRACCALAARCSSRPSTATSSRSCSPIVGGEYLLRLLPRGTHEYERLIVPSELARWARAAGLSARELAGVEFNPLTGRVALSADVSVNYLVHLSGECAAGLRRRRRGTSHRGAARRAHHAAAQRPAHRGAAGRARRRTGAPRGERAAGGGPAQPARAIRDAAARRIRLPRWRDAAHQQRAVPAAGARGARTRPGGRSRARSRSASSPSRSSWIRCAAALERTEAQVQALERERREAFSALRTQIESLAGGQAQLQRETRNLVTALRRPEVRGRWGELTLRRLVELAGLPSTATSPSSCSWSARKARCARTWWCTCPTRATW